VVADAPLDQLGQGLAVGAAHATHGEFQIDAGLGLDPGAGLAGGVGVAGRRGVVGDVAACKRAGSGLAIKHPVLQHI
jgi:hypothetical protein